MKHKEFWHLKFGNIPFYIHIPVSRGYLEVNKSKWYDYRQTTKGNSIHQALSIIKQLDLIPSIVLALGHAYLLS